MEDPIKATVEKMADNNCLTCKQAHLIAKEFDVELAELAQIIEETGVKVTSCQLGCF